MKICLPKLSGLKRKLHSHDIGPFHTLCLLITVWMLFSCENNVTLPAKDATFNAFHTNGQTLPTSLDNAQKQVRVEVGHDVDITRLVPEFTVPQGYTAYINGQPQVSRESVVDFSHPVSYQLRNQHNQTTTWQTSVVPLSCKILVDASHDGGVWWFPQSPQSGFNAQAHHQGKPFADMLRKKGFEVTELPRGIELSDELFYGHYIVIRASGFSPYTPKELQVYSRLLERGMNLVFFTDHKRNDPKDELGEHLGIKYEGVAKGKVAKFASHQITKNLSTFEYVAGSVLTNAAQNKNIEILGWLGADDFADLNFNSVRDANEPLAPPVMGVLYYPKSRIFFMGDQNAFQFQPQPFIDNLIEWMGTCFVP